ASLRHEVQGAAGSRRGSQFGPQPVEVYRPVDVYRLGGPSGWAVVATAVRRAACTWQAGAPGGAAAWGPLSLVRVQPRRWPVHDQRQYVPGLCDLIWVPFS